MWVGLYEPKVTNTTGLYTSDYVTYTANADAGAKLDISCGGDSATQKDILANSAVELRREIRITENGKYITTGDQTTYIPYTIGSNAVKIEINMRIFMAGVDRGIYQTKTINLSTTKPSPMALGTTKSDCSLLRYTYNESEKLASIPKGTAVEVIAQEGSYYQVCYNNWVGYVGTSLLEVNTSVGDTVIQHVEVTIDEPVAGQTPASTCAVHTTGCQLYQTDPVT